MNEETFFMVFVENERGPVFKHKTLASAETEAKRLAKELKKKATVLCSVKSFEIIEFKVTDMRPAEIEDLPF